MTPAEAYEHVRLRRPRVLLASAQWQVSHHQNYMFLYAMYELCSFLISVLVLNVFN